MLYQIRLENFEGPFELLIHLIERAEIDIYDIPIARITREYLEYLEEWENLDLDAASEFLLMAARLLEIKSKCLLPGLHEEKAEDEEQDPREELVERLLEYKYFRKLASLLREIAREQGGIFTRVGEKPESWFPEGQPLAGHTVRDLSRAFKKVLENAPSPRLPEIRAKRVTVPEKIEELCSLLARRRGGVDFRELLHPDSSRLEIIITFLALLELVYQGKVRVYQERVFGEILIMPWGE